MRAMWLLGVRPKAVKSPTKGIVERKIAADENFAVRRLDGHGVDGTVGTRQILNEAGVQGAIRVDPRHLAGGRSDDDSAVGLQR